MPSIDMTKADVRETVFKTVFNTPNGQAVLDWLDKSFKITHPDLVNPNDVYYRLGRQAVVNMIRNLTKGE